MTVQLGDTVQTDPNECPYCTAKHDAATGLTGEGGPTPGCFSICAQCSNLSVFTENLQLRKVTEEDYASLSKEDLEELMYARKVALLSTIEIRRSKGEDIVGVAFMKDLGV